MVSPRVFRGVFVKELGTVETRTKVAVRVFDSKKTDLKYGNPSRDLEVLQTPFRHENFIAFLEKMEQPNYV